MRLSTALVVIALLGADARAAHAQLNPRQSRWNAPEWMGDVAFTGMNALASGLGAGIIQRVKGGSFADGFTRGALGGAVHYAGMRVTVQRFDGAGLLGRQISAVGISMTRNAAEGRGTLDQLFVPLGPVNLYVRLGDSISVRPKLNVASLVVLASAAAESRLDFDPGASLSAGAPVFDAPGRSVLSNGDPVGGFVTRGVIVLSDHPTDASRAHALAHERVHVAQSDWLFQVVSDPMEGWLLERIPGGATLYRYIDVDMVGRFVGGGLYALFGIEYEDQLHELEAYFLDDR